MNSKAVRKRDSRCEQCGLTFRGQLGLKMHASVCRRTLITPDRVSTRPVPDAPVRQHAFLEVPSTSDGPRLDLDDELEGVVVKWRERSQHSVDFPASLDDHVVEKERPSKRKRPTERRVED